MAILSAEISEWKQRRSDNAHAARFLIAAAGSTQPSQLTTGEVPEAAHSCQAGGYKHSTQVNLSCALHCGRVQDYTPPGRLCANPRTNRYDAALVRCIDFERESSKLDTDAQTILLLAFREHHPHRVICQIARCSERALSNKIPAALPRLAALLNRANML